MKFRLPRRAPTSPSLDDLADISLYPVLNATQLIRMLGVSGRIGAIKRYAAQPAEAFEALYLPAIERFTELAQLQPASTTDHHCGLGGLISHTLEVVEIAMAERRRYQLPINAGPEQIAREEQDWTYAVFAAALLHDAGKLLMLTKLTPSTREPYSPLGGTLLETTRAESYTISFVNAHYELQTRLSIVFLHILPPAGLTRVARIQKLLGELTAWLGHVPYEWGVIGKICRAADQASVHRDMTPGKPRAPLLNAPVRSVGERLMQAIRTEIQNASLVLNRDGAAGWLKDGSLWLVCKPAMAKARARLISTGSIDIPEDDTRLFDSLLDHGYLIPTPEGLSIWHVRVQCQDYDHALTMLRFDALRVVHPSRQVTDFAGQITPISRTDLLQRRKAGKRDDAVPSLALLGERTAPTVPLMQSNIAPAIDPAPPVPNAETPSLAPRPIDPPAPDPLPRANPVLLADTNPQSQEPLDSPPVRGSAQTQEASVDTDDTVNPAQRSAQALNRLVLRTRQDVTHEPVPMNSPMLGRYFLTWVRQGLDEARISINSPEKSRALVHVLEEHVALVYPALVNLFLNHTGLETSQSLPILRAASDQLRHALRRDELKLLIPTKAKYDIHQVLLPSPLGTRYSTLYCLLVPVWSLYDKHEKPPVNDALEVRQGVYKPHDKLVNYRRKN